MTGNWKVGFTRNDHVRTVITSDRIRSHSSGPEVVQMLGPQL